MGTQEGQLGELGGHSATTPKLWKSFQGHRDPGRGVPAHWTLWGAEGHLMSFLGPSPELQQKTRKRGKEREGKLRRRKVRQRERTKVRREGR